MTVFNASLGCQRNRWKGREFSEIANPGRRTPRHRCGPRRNLRGSAERPVHAADTCLRGHNGRPSGAALLLGGYGNEQVQVAAVGDIVWRWVSNVLADGCPDVVAAARGAFAGGRLFGRLRGQHVPRLRVRRNSLPGSLLDRDAASGHRLRCTTIALAVPVFDSQSAGDYSHVGGASWVDAQREGG